MNLPIQLIDTLKEEEMILIVGGSIDTPQAPTNDANGSCTTTNNGSGTCSASNNGSGVCSATNNGSGTCK